MTDLNITLATVGDYQVVHQDDGRLLTTTYINRQTLEVEVTETRHHAGALCPWAEDIQAERNEIVGGAA